MTNGTVTFTLFIGRFNNNDTASGAPQYANPELDFYAGLPGSAGYQSFITIPFSNVKIATAQPPPGPGPSNPTATSTQITSPALGAIIDAGLDAVVLTSLVTADGVPVNEGQVEFLENGTISLGFAPVVQGIATLRPTQPLQHGNDAITAVYSDAAGGFGQSVSAPVVVAVDSVVVDKTSIKVVAPDGTTRFQVNPFGVSKHTGLNVAGVDLNNGTKPLLFVAARRGATPKVRVYDAVSGQALRTFLAYPRSQRGGVSLAAASFKGGDELVTAPGRGASPLIKVFDVLTGRLLLKFLAFNRRYREGTDISVATSASGSGFAITAATTSKGLTLTRTFDGTTGAQTGATVVTGHKAR